MRKLPHRSAITSWDGGQYFSFDGLKTVAVPPMSYNCAFLKKP